MPRPRRPYGGGGYYMASGKGSKGSSSSSGEDINIDDVNVKESYSPEGEPQANFEDTRGFLGRLFRPNSAERLEKSFLIDSINSGQELSRDKALQSFILGESEKIQQDRLRLENEAYALADDAVRRSRSPFNAGESVVLGGTDEVDLPYALSQETRGRALRQLPNVSGGRRKVAEDTLGQRTAERGEQKAATVFPNELETAKNMSEANRLTSSYALEGTQGGDYKDAVIRSLVAELQKKNAIPLSEGGAVLLPDGTIAEGGYNQETLGEQPYMTGPKGEKIPFGERPVTKQRMPAGISRQPGGLQGFQQFLGGGVSPYGSAAEPNVDPKMFTGILDDGPAPMINSMQSDEDIINRIQGLKPQYPPQPQREPLGIPGVDQLNSGMDKGEEFIRKLLEFLHMNSR